MQCEPFKIEDWLNQHEKQISYHLSESCAHAFTVESFFSYIHEPISLLEKCSLGYQEITGSKSLKEAIANMYEGITSEQVAVTLGISNANVMALMEFGKAGDQILVPVPTYDHFTRFATSLGMKVIEFPFEDSSNTFDLQSFLKKMEEVDLVAIVNPNNPTGYTFTKEDIQTIQQKAQSCACTLIVDEAYRFMTLDRNDSFAKNDDSILVTGGLAKAFGLPGLRMGWIISSSKNIQRINYRRDYHIIALSPIQDVCATLALKHSKELLERTHQNIQANTQYLKTWLQENPMFTVSQTGGSLRLLYGPMDSAKFSEYLYQKYHLLLAPGECFEKKKCYRLSLSIEPQTFLKGLEIVSQESKLFPF